MKPLLEVTKTEEIIAQKEVELRTTSEKLRRSVAHVDDMNKRIETVLFY